MATVEDMSSLLQGLRVRPSIYATTIEPRKVHVKTRAMSETYHRRVQKKWIKRFGTWQAPGAYILHGHTLIAHPDIIRRLEAHIERQRAQQFRVQTSFGIPV